MAIKGISRDSVPYVPEEDRTSPFEEQTIFWIKPKTGKEANRTMQRYAACGRDARKGYRELNVRKLNNADVEEFLEVVSKVENFFFIEDKEITKLIDDDTNLIRLMNELSADLLLEIFDAANNMSQLSEGQKKS